MPEKKETADLLAPYSDAVFAVIVTIMVLELRPPEQAALSDLWPLWPTAVSADASQPFRIQSISLRGRVAGICA
jgi:Endosomal/lysosomal potassium channel TMEM175